MSIPLDPVAVATRLRAIPGITDIFPPSRQLTRIVDAVAALVSADAGRTNPIAATATDGILTITADIGTSRDRRTPETAREVADVLLAAGGPNTTVSVQVSRIA